jgi:hypothetical protein
MRKNLLKLGAVASAILLGGYSIANAVPTLTISDGTTTVTILDNGAGDQSATAGWVLWSGNFGVWDVIVDTGITKPIGGFSAINPGLDLGFQVSSTAAGSLTMTWSDTDFGPWSGGFAADIGGTLAAGASISYSTYYSKANTVPAGTPLTSTLSSFSGAAANVGNLGFPYSLSEVVILTQRQAGVSSGNAELHGVPVPDAGSTLILLGTTMSMLGVYDRSRRKRQKA